jgi:hypothetical protein
MGSGGARALRSPCCLPSGAFVGTIEDMPIPPWVIEQMKDERARREEEERVRSQRIELPQTGGVDDNSPDRATEAPSTGLVIVDVSPRADNCVDI